MGAYNQAQALIIPFRGIPTGASLASFLLTPFSFLVSQVVIPSEEAALLRSDLSIMSKISDEDVSDNMLASYDIVPRRTHEDLQKVYQSFMNQAENRVHEYVDVDLPMIVDGGDW